ncbi:helix-turn-helix domain-containing protein [Aeromonas veronii]
MLHYKDNTAFAVDERHFSNQTHPALAHETIPHQLDNCLHTAFCVHCPHWLLLQKRFINLGLFDDKFFERREFRFERICRAVCFFCSNFNVTVSKDCILSYVWQESKAVSMSNVNVLIYDLRLLFIRQNVEIINIRGQGYRLEAKHHNS